MKRFSTSTLFILAVLPVLSIVFPITSLLFHSSFADMLAVVRKSEVQAAFWTSGSAALTTTALACLFGLPCAFLLARMKSGWKRVFEGIVLLPLVLPPLVGGMAELSVLGPNTSFGQALAVLGLNVTDSWAGVVIAQSFVTAPFLILAAKAGFEDVPTELPEAASLSGAGSWTQLLYIFIPIAGRAILAGVLLTLTRAFGEFGATMMMAYHPYTVPVDLYVQFSAGGLPSLLPIASIVVLVAVVVAALAGVLSAAAGRRG